jgi:hypothetical protein
MKQPMNRLQLDIKFVWWLDKSLCNINMSSINIYTENASGPQKCTATMTVAYDGSVLSHDV